MWSNRLRPILLRCSGCIFRKTHHSSASSDVPLCSQASQRTSHLRKKQVVLEKVNTNEQGIKRIKIYPPPSLMESQSVILPGPERIRASGATSHPEDYVVSPDKDTFTVCGALMKGVNKSISGRCMGRRNPLGTGKYEWISYTQVVERLHYIGSGLVNLGISPSQESKVGICTKTRPEFLLTLLACSHYSMVLVPLYECFGADVLNHIIHQAEMEVVFCENSKIADDIIERADQYPSLKHIILIDDETESLNPSSIKILTLKHLEECGKKNRIEPKKPNPDDLLCICYTSGTTGVPKGVMVTHGNALASIGALDTVLGDSIPKSGSLMCYLPCAHIYEILNEIFCLYHGGQLGFYSGKTETLLSDIAEFQPDVLPLVPKLMNLIYSGVKKKIGPNLFRRQLFRLSLGQKEKKLKKGIVAKTAIWDKLILSKIQRVLGGRVQMIFNSSAPASKEVMQFFRCSMGSLVFEVYGLSEVGAAAMTLLAEHESGFVGPPLPCNHIKLVSVPELSYFAENDTGEICLRGANVFSGYYKNPEATKEAIDNDGWYHTGDIGKWLANGALSIIDRKKHIFKLVQGEYIIPDKSENVYIQSPLISQVYIDGDSNEEFIIGIVVPDPNSFIKWAEEKGFKNLKSDYEALCQNKEVKLALMSHLLELGKKRKLNSLHQVGNIYICTVPFTSENNLLTPTMKLKRSASRKHFESVIKSLYQEGNLRKIHNL